MFTKHISKLPEAFASTGDDYDVDASFAITVQNNALVLSRCTGNEFIDILHCLQAIWRTICTILTLLLFVNYNTDTNTTNTTTVSHVLSFFFGAKRTYIFQEFYRYEIF